MNGPPPPGGAAGRSPEESAAGAPASSLPVESAARVGAAYDAVAAGYDQLVQEDGWMRERLWAHHLRVFAPGARVLDVACGTGLDTLHLAALDRCMTAVDASAGMLAELHRKASARGLAAAIEVRLGDAAHLDAWPAASFDGMLSSFAGLNTIDPAPFAAAAARLLRPGGRAVLHLLAPGGSHAGERTVEIGGQALRHALPEPGDLYARHFAGGFVLRLWYGLGWLLPRRAGRRLPKALLVPLGRLDALLGHLPPWRGAGRFYVLDLERRRAM